MVSSKSTKKLLSGALLLLAATLLPGVARASKEFPEAIQVAAGMPCAPSCKLCHGQAKGDLASFAAKALSRALSNQGFAPKKHDTNFVKQAFAKYKADPNNAEQVQALVQGIDPETGEGLCGPAYGCGAHLAKQTPPADLTAPLWIVGAMVVGGLLRRHKSSAS